jgi:Nucleotidyl transferase AbiEii toxin, Type IV TA system
LTLPRRLIHSEYDLQGLAERLDRPIELIERDFALVTVAAHLADQFPGQLCFKGGFVLRHVRGSSRFSADLDATPINPPKHKVAAAEIAETMRRATDEPMLRIEPGVPVTDSQHSLDFDQIAFHTPHHDGQIAVEISYREAVAYGPEWEWPRLRERARTDRPVPHRPRDVATMSPQHDLEVTECPR